MSDENYPPFEDVERRMRPGQFSEVGFLGEDERLRDVLDADARALAALNVTPGALASRLQSLLVRAIEAKRDSTIVDGFRVRLRRYKGFQLCPFAPRPLEMPCPGPGDPRLASIEWTISHRANGARMAGPGLIAHLIGTHGFFEGRESPYRVDPRDLAILLELANSPAAK
jgi:hypothetical protein